jgi:hypothetical protein
MFVSGYHSDEFFGLNLYKSVPMNCIKPCKPNTLQAEQITMKGILFSYNAIILEVITFWVCDM